MSEERENYCKLLGINPFKESSYTEHDIMDRIDKAEAGWKKELQSVSITKRGKFLLGENLKMIPDMRSTMDSSILRVDEFASARKLLERKASKIRKDAIILHNGDIVVPQTAADKLAEKLQWASIDGKTVIQASGLKTVPAPRAVNPSITNAFRMISDLGAYSPHDLINSIIEIPELDLRIDKVEPDCDFDALRLAYDVVGKRLNNVNNRQIPNLDGYIQAVRAVRGNSDDKKLEDLINYGKCMKALEPAFEQMDEDSGNQFSREYIDNILNTYVNRESADPELCLTLLEDYCIRRMFPANFSEKDSGLTMCPRCRAMIYTGANLLFCPSCGAAVSEVCPCCGAAQTSSNNNCVGCGAELASALSDSQGYDEDIRKMLAAGMTDKAVAEYAELESRYPSYSKNQQLKAKIRETAEKLNAMVDMISTDYLARNYFALKRTVEDGSVEFPQLTSHENVHLRYEEACRHVKEADELCVKAVEAGKEEAKELYINASSVCPDHPDAVAKLKSYPPEGPADGEVQPNGDCIELSYAVPEDRRGMTFCIFRNEGSFPEVDQSTRPVAEIEGWVYTDTNVEPGTEYYYRIYSKRWGVMSSEYAECGPAMVLREVTNVVVEQCDDGLKLTYGAPLGCSRVRVWRKRSGEEKGEGEEDEILHDNNGVIIDDDLESGTTYSYLFVAEYDINENTERSCGTMFSGTTAVLPAPVNDLSVRWDRDGDCYVAKWTGSPDAVLYYSNQKESVPGKHVSVKDLETVMTRIEPIPSDDGVFRFNLPEATVTYICPAITVGSTTIRGNECIVANLRPFKDLMKSIGEYNCRLTMTWPEDAEYALATVTAKDGEGNDTVTETEMSRDQYEEMGGLDIALNGSAYTNILLTAEYEIDGTKQRSIALSTEIFSGDYSRVGYTISKESVKGDRKKTRVCIEFSCPGQTVIPHCVMVQAEEGIPLRESDGTRIWESMENTILADGAAVCDFVIAKEDADLSKMRLFFTDRKNYNKYRFMHPLFRRK